LTRVSEIEGRLATHMRQHHRAPTSQPPPSYLSLGICRWSGMHRRLTRG
jgi:hypothetical protein